MKTYLFAILAILISNGALGVEASTAKVNQPISQSVSSDQVKDKLIGQILAISGMEHSLQKLPEQIKAGFKGSISRGKIAPDEQRQMLNIYTDAYPEGAFVISVRKALESNYDENRYARFLQLISTPLSMRMTKLEAIEPTPVDFRQYISQVASHPLTPERIALIQRMDADTKTSAMMSKIEISTIESNAMAFANDCSDNVKIKKVIEDKRPEIEKATRSTAQVMLAFTYRDVSDADLNEYLKTYEDKDGKWVQDFVQKAIEKQFDSSIETEAKGMKLFAESHRPKKTMFAPKCD